MNTKVPNILLLAPPVIGAIVIGLGIGLLTLGLSLYNGDSQAGEIALMWSGIGVVLGFLWGSIVWSERLSKIYTPPKKYEKTTTAPTPIRIDLLMSNHGYTSGKFIELPAEITYEQLVKVARLLVKNGWNFSHDIAGNNMPISRKQFTALRDTMIGAGLAQWRSKRSRTQGVELLPPGKSLFNQLATTPPQGDKATGLLSLLEKKQAHT